ncbi:hypothetical protein ACQPXH_13260 [Nocardia sp. CA-135953]|uniref:hypothetical protein n=1 Tax=Nocardia sp. CA-135953 TaxID=3239978 RepID=UPI003D99C15F
MGWKASPDHRDTAEITSSQYAIQRGVQLGGRLDIAADDMMLITAAVDGHLIGAALQLAEENRRRARSGLRTDDELAAAAQPMPAPILADGRYPAFARWLAARTTTSGADPVEWTLTSLLDGITDRLELPK